MKPMTINQKTRKPISNALYQISRDNRHTGIPVDAIDQVLRDNGFKLIQEDGEDWEGLFCGREGSCTIQVATLEGVPCNHLLALQWYKRVTTYEINCYLS